MNSEAPTIGFHWDMPILLVLIGVIVLLTVIVSGRRLPEIARSFAKFLVMGVLLLLIAGFFWSRGTPMQITTRLVPERSSATFNKSLASEKATSSTGDVESAKSDIELPEWTRQPVRADGSRKLIVVRSGRFASEEEAELHGFQQAAVTAVKEFSSLDPRRSGAMQPQHTDIVKEAGIKSRFMEKTDQYDFGKFKAPMHQLWLQVELTPELGERLAESWRQAAIEARLRTLTGWSVWGTAAAAMAAFALRLDAAWNGRRRAVIAGTVIALTLGSLAFLA